MPPSTSGCSRPHPTKVGDQCATKGGKIEAFHHSLLRVRRKWGRTLSEHSMETVQRVVSTLAITDARTTRRRDRLMFKNPDKNVLPRWGFLIRAEFLSWDSTFHVVNAQS